MTRKEARTFLNGTKVYVEGKSNEIQEKLFSLGYTWGDKGKVMQYEEKPFLFINEDLLITYSDDVVYFKKESTERELSADKILSIEVTVSYRPFNTKKECWNEMLKHQPFVWVIDKYNNFYHIDFVYSCNPDNGYGVRLSKNISIDFEHLFRDFKFADGKPFGIKEELV